MKGRQVKKKLSTRIAIYPTDESTASKNSKLNLKSKEMVDQPATEILRRRLAIEFIRLVYQIISYQFGIVIIRVPPSQSPDTNQNQIHGLVLGPLK